MNAQVLDDDTPTVATTLSGGKSGTFTMNDVGSGMFTTSISLSDASTPIELILEVEDAQNQTERFPFNPTQKIEIELAGATGDLVINEFMASNSATISDESGAFADWAELYNPTDSEISLSGYYLTDDLAEPTKWAFPDTVIAAKGFLLIWVDDDEEDGPMHVSFKLSKDGEDLGLYFDNGSEIVAVDAFTFGAQQTDVSYGREEDGAAGFVFFDTATPGSSNNPETSTVESSGDEPILFELHQNYPNPFNPNTTLSFTLNTAEEITLKVYSITGSFIRTAANGYHTAGTHSVRFNASQLASGVYVYRLETKSGASLTRKMSLIK